MSREYNHVPRPQGEVCCICFKTTGFSEKDVRRLPNGKLAQYACINGVFHKEVFNPAKNIIPDLPAISMLGKPEHVINAFLEKITKYPEEIVSQIISNVDQFAQNMLGKEINKKGFIPTF